MAATAHLPEHQPKGERELPQGRKNWDKPPQQVPGPEGPEPHPTPEEAGAGRVSNAKKPQQTKGPEGPDPQESWPPRGHFTSTERRPQQVSGEEGPEATDGTELIDAAQPLTGQKPAGKASVGRKSTSRGSE